MAKVTNEIEFKVSAKDRASKAFAKVQASVASLTRAAGIASAVVAATAGAMFLLTKRTADSIDKIGKHAKLLGISAQALSELQGAAGFAGIELRTFNLGIQRMVRRLSEAKIGTGVAGKALEELGIDIQHIASLKPDEQMNVLADAMSKVSDKSKLLRLNVAIFDTEAAQMGRLLQGGSKALMELRERMRRTGNTFNDVAVRDAAAFNDAMKDVTDTISGLGSQMALKLMPTFTKLMLKMAEVIQSFGGVSGAITKLVTIAKAGFNIISLAMQVMILPIKTSIKALILLGTVWFDTAMAIFETSKWLWSNFSTIFEITWLKIKVGMANLVSIFVTSYNEILGATRKTALAIFDSFSKSFGKMIDNFSSSIKWIIDKYNTVARFFDIKEIEFEGLKKGVKSATEEARKLLVDMMPKDLHIDLSGLEDGLGRLAHLSVLPATKMGEAWKKVKDRLANNLKSIGNDFGEAGVALLRTLNAAFDLFSDNAEAAVTIVQSTMNRAEQHADEMFKRLVANAKKATGAVKKLTEAQKDAAKGRLQVGDVDTNFQKRQPGQLETALRGATDFKSMLINILVDMFRKVIDSVIAKFKEATQKWITPIAEEAGRLAKAVIDQVKFLMPLSKAIVAMVTPLNSILLNISALAIDVLQLKPAVKILTQLLKSIEGINKVFNEFFGDFSDFKNTIQPLSTSISFLIDGVKGLIDIAKPFTDILSKGMDKVKSLNKILRTTIGSILDMTGVTEVLRISMEGLSTIGGQLSETLGLLTETVVITMDALKPLTDILMQMINLALIPLQPLLIALQPALFILTLTFKSLSFAINTMNKILSTFVVPPLLQVVSVFVTIASELSRITIEAKRAAGAFGGQSGGSTGGSTGGGGGGLPSPLPFPPPFKFPTFARGGIVTKPTLAMIGDNPSNQEAVIPLRGGKVPVQLIGGGKGVEIGTVNITIQVDSSMENRSAEFWEQLIAAKILPALNVAGNRGETTSLPFKEFGT